MSRPSQDADPSSGDFATALDQDQLRLELALQRTTASGRTATGEEAQTNANVYRTRIKGISDYVAAAPVPDWPKYVTPVGAALAGGGSVVLGLSGLSDRAEIGGSVALYLFAAALLYYAVRALKESDRGRVRAYYLGRALFNQWAGLVGIEPYESVSKKVAESEVEAMVARIAKQARASVDDSVR